MPRYFFHIHDGVDQPDSIGTELSDLNAARVHAVQVAASLLGGDTSQVWDGHDWSVEVKNEVGVVQFTLSFSATDVSVHQSASG